MSTADTGHAGGSGAPAPARDGRVDDLVHHAYDHNVTGRSQHEPAADPHRGAGQEAHGHGGYETQRNVRTGTVIQSFPYYNWCRVQLDGTGATIGCAPGGLGHTPAGPRDVSPVPPPYTHVAVLLPSGRSQHGVILSALPAPHSDPRLTCPDYTAQGHNSSVAQREDVYTLAVRQLYRQGGVTCYGGPVLDATSLDWGTAYHTGVELNLDPHMATLRVSEVCGLWLSYFDDYARLAAWNLDLQTAAHELVVRSDEGENRLIEYRNVYPWESLGLYAPQDFTATFTAAQVQFELPRGAVDLAAGDEDLQPVNRYQEHGAYLGQGGRRQVNVPAKDSGKRHYADSPYAFPDAGVWEETVSLSGDYGLRFARSGLICRYPLIPVPKEMRPPEDQKVGDDARRDNYKFSGRYGGGEAHEIGEVRVDGDRKSLRTAAGVLDMMAYLFNWQGLHPFHYHHEDYALPQEGDLYRRGMPARAQERVDFSAPGGRMYLFDPDAGGLVKVDDRYGQVSYPARVAFLYFPPDGGIALGDGYGAEVTLTGGRIRLSAPLGVDVTPGTDFNVVAGRDVNLRARDSVDVSAGRKDVHIKGQLNVQLLSNAGGVVIESKATGYEADFKNKVGEDVRAGGVFVKAANAPFVAWAGDVLLRTGGDHLQAGRIVLDSSKGRQPIVLKGDVEMYCHTKFAGWVGPVESVSAVEAAFEFTATGAVLDRRLLVGDDVLTLGGLTANGPIVCLGPVAAVNDNGGRVGHVDGGDLARAVAPVRATLRADRQEGQRRHQAQFPADLYQAGRPGDDELIGLAGFSFRDDGGGVQYHADAGAFFWAESRWQMMQRLGLGSGGTPWGSEPVVNYQGRQQLPWPGRQNWELAETLVGPADLTMFDAGRGLAMDRPGPYKDPRLAAEKKMTPAAQFLVQS